MGTVSQKLRTALLSKYTETVTSIVDFTPPSTEPRSQNG